MDQTCHLEISHLTLSYGDYTALDDVALCVAPRSVHVVLGEDGAGKTSLMKVLSGAIPAGGYTGELRLAGELLAPRSLADGVHAGISIVPRKIAVFERMSVADNVMIASWQRERRFVRLGRETERRATELLEAWKFNIDVGAPVQSLSALQQRQLMIARALAIEPNLIVLDEPLFGISGQHAASQLFWTVRRIVDHGITCLYLTRRLTEAMQVADVVTILRDGQVAGSWQRPDFDEPAMLAAMASQRLGDRPRPVEDDFGDGGGWFGPLRETFDRWFKPGS